MDITKADAERNRTSNNKQHQDVNNPELRLETQDSFKNTLTSLTESGQAELLSNLQSDQRRIDLSQHLQHTYGNAYVQRLLNTGKVQAKITISQPDDPYEIEADAVAEKVIHSADADIQRQSPLEEEELLQGKFLQRQEIPEEEELVQAKLIQRQEIPEEEEIQTKSIQREEESSLTQTSFDNIERSIESARGSGQFLEESVRASMEPGFSHDFSDVKVHTDSQADRISRQLEAEAFTTGKDIFFREGNFQPDSESGKKLLAHELTHVVQQNGG